jgi:WhiB family redox-sensing transcriptional regulator
MSAAPIPPAHRLLGDHAWQDHGACREVADIEPDLFFPEPDQILIIREAKTYCARCPVQQICLDAALETNSRFGIWGGLTEDEREPLHLNLDHREDQTRINQALTGRDVHLTLAERRAFARAAHARGWSATDVARQLHVSVDHAKKLLRRARRQSQNRQLNAGTTTVSRTARPLGKAA